MFNVSGESLIMGSLGLVSCSAFIWRHGTAAEAWMIAARAIPEPCSELHDGITRTSWDLAMIIIRSKAVKPPQIMMFGQRMSTPPPAIPSQSFFPSYSFSPQATGTEGLRLSLECGLKASTKREILADDIAQTNSSPGAFRL